jgi:hypothetical protein
VNFLLAFYLANEPSKVYNPKSVFTVLDKLVGQFFMRFTEIVSGGPIDYINSIKRSFLRAQKYNFNLLSNLEQLADPFAFIPGKIPITICPLFVTEFICDRADTVYDTQIMVYKQQFFQPVRFL